MLALAAFFYVAGIVLPLLFVAGMFVVVALLYCVWGLTLLRLPRIEVGTWRGMGGFTLRLLAMFVCISGVAALFS